MKIFGILFLTIIILFTTCNTTEPPPEDNRKLILTLEDAFCTEVWFKLETENLQLPAEINILQDDSISHILILNTQDSLLYIDSLLPNKTYIFKVELSGIGNPGSGIQSNELSVTTMDTTSHNFTFETWTFGGTAGSSTLYDVAIVNENCIWAVGEIYVADTSANGYTMYNAVYWDGNEWTLKRITVEFRGFQITPPFEGAFAFSSTDIWFVGSLPIHGDGENWVMYDLRTTMDPNLSLSKVWGANSDYMYFVGRNGSIAHKQNNNWSKIKSGTNTFIVNIWGVPDGKGNYNKYCTNIDAMIKIDSENTIQRINTEQGHSVGSVWGKTDRLIYTAGGSGLSLYKNYKWAKIDDPDVNTIYGIKGQKYNDILGLSSTRSVLHFNGYNWQFINTPKNNSNLRLTIKNNIAVVVGWLNESAQITILKRN